MVGSWDVGVELVGWWWCSSEVAAVLVGSVLVGEGGPSSVLLALLAICSVLSSSLRYRGPGRNNNDTTQHNTTQHNVNTQTVTAAVVHVV